MKKETYQPIMSTEYKNWYIIPNVPKEILANEKGFILNTITGNITRGSWVGHYLRYRWQGVNYYMQRLIALAFKGIPIETNMVVNHIDGNKRNNKASNLEWITQQANVIHGYNTGLYKNKGINRSFENISISNSDLIPLFEYDHHMNPEYMSEIIERDLVQFEDYTYTNLNQHRRLYKPLYDIEVISTSKQATLAELQIESSYGGYVNGVMYYVSKEELSLLEDFREGKYEAIKNYNFDMMLEGGVIKPHKDYTYENKQIYIDNNYLNLVKQAANIHSDYFYEDFINSTISNEYELLFKDYLV